MTQTGWSAEWFAERLINAVRRFDFPREVCPVLDDMQRHGAYDNLIWSNWNIVTTHRNTAHCYGRVLKKKIAGRCIIWKWILGHGYYKHLDVQVSNQKTDAPSPTTISGLLTYVLIRADSMITASVSSSDVPIRPVGFRTRPSLCQIASNLSCMS